MLCLGIESSCDETGLALVQDGRVLHSVLATQVNIHALFGGVVPELASREHYRYIGPLFDHLIQESGVQPSQIDVVAVARGPGLLGSLLVGTAFAKGLALALGARLLGINHLHAHLLAAGLEHTLCWPALGLLVSGGHTHLYTVTSPSHFQLLGRTLDDAAGEAFDKVAKMLNLPYPGGKLLDTLAQKGTAQEKLFPRPYLDNDNLDFSFSGLKTAAALYVAEHPELLQQAASVTKGEMPKGLCDFCASFRVAVVATLLAKTRRALHRGRYERILLAGGVAANWLLREKMAELASEEGIELLVPSLPLCTDNPEMIAYCGFLLSCDGWEHALDMETIPRGRVIPYDMLQKTVPK